MSRGGSDKARLAKGAFGALLAVSVDAASVGLRPRDVGGRILHDTRPCRAVGGEMYSGFRRRRGKGRAERVRNCEGEQSDPAQRRAPARLAAARPRASAARPQARRVAVSACRVRQAAWASRSSSCRPAGPPGSSSDVWSPAWVETETACIGTARGRMLLCSCPQPR